MTIEAHVFEEAIKGTRHAPASVAAARLVLVDGLRPVDASAQTGASVQHISRTTKAILEASRKAMVESSGLSTELAIVEKRLSASYTQAVQAAREKMGVNSVLSAPDLGGQYLGAVVFRNEMHVVQDVGRGQMVIHELAKLERVPLVGSTLEIRYSREPLRPALVVDRERSKQRGGIAR
jgi:hypothetical protein